MLVMPVCLSFMGLQSSAKRNILFLLFYSSLANFNSETEGGVALAKFVKSPKESGIWRLLGEDIKHLWSNGIRLQHGFATFTCSLGFDTLS